jgi:FkbM family methyltransferase
VNNLTLQRRGIRTILVSGVRWIVTQRFFDRFTDFVTRTRVGQSETVNHAGSTLILSHVNPQTRSRNTTFATKEPETLTWIESFLPGQVLWDIGANVGLYSVYAAKKDVQVVAIEPSVFNLEFLVRNICLNKLENKIWVLPMAVGTPSPSFETLNLASASWGDSGNAFATNKDSLGQEGRFSFSYNLPGIPLDSLTTIFRTPEPDHVKIDVDGIEADIVESGPRVFSRVSSVLVEVPKISGSSERIAEALTFAGLTLRTITRQNQIWFRE